MLREMNVAFIGSGKMAEAMIAGLLSNEVLAPQQIVATGPRKARARDLVKRFGIRASTDNRDACGCDVIVLSVKPKAATTVFRELKAEIATDTLVISIMAGVALETIADGLGVDNVIRCMPNTPGRIRKGITGVAANGISRKQLECGREIVKALGEEIFFDDETDLNMVTALSGSGPAYFLLIAEAMIAPAVQRGMSQEHARKLVLHTMLGTAQLALQSANHLSELRDQVTSPGGTTAAALYELEKGGLRTVIADAVHAACEKSTMLGARKPA